MHNKIINKRYLVWETEREHPIGYYKELAAI